MSTMKAAAVLSDDGAYRYSLRRWWAQTGYVRFIMLNPSTADADQDDPTIRRCIAFARTWGYGGIVVHNLFALRATDPRALSAHVDPIGPENRRHLRGEGEGAMLTGFTVCAWGAHPMAVSRGPEVLDLLRDAGEVAHCLGITRTGAPRHPLYLRRSVEPRRLDALVGVAT